MTSSPANPFATENAGVVYARGRPYHHPRTLARVLGIVGRQPVAHALDVACGTGMSTTALASHAGLVVGVDRSAEMLRSATRGPNISYLLGDAARVPLGDASFDAVTCCSGVHWFDQPRFFAEMHRVLRPGGWIGLYDHYFGDMRGVGGFRDWARALFDRFPLPPRNPQVGDPASATPAGFEVVGTDLFEDPIEMTRDVFVDYQLSVSHCVAAVDRGTPRDEVRAWLEQSVAPLFADAPAVEVQFLGSITCLRRVP